MSTAEAIEHLRADPEYADLIRDAYLGPTRGRRPRASSTRPSSRRPFAWSAASRGVTFSTSEPAPGSRRWRSANAGAARVYAVDPDPSPIVGRGAIARLGDDRIEIVDGVGEEIPLPDESVDVFYGRQVLHHTRDLDAVAREANRVLRPGGFLFCCREHVVADDEELAEFLEAHPVHQLAGGENAYTLDQYVGAIERSGLRLRHAWGLYDTIINAFPVARTNDELKQLRQMILGRPLAAMGGLAARLPVTSALVRKRLAPHTYPGAPHAFVAVRPDR